MTEQQNPFDDEALAFCVLVNLREQYSLWPAFAPIPAGWQSVAGPMPRPQAIDYIETHWLAMQPAAV